MLRNRFNTAGLISRVPPMATPVISAAVLLVPLFGIGTIAVHPPEETEKQNQSNPPELIVTAQKQEPGDSLQAENEQEGPTDTVLTVPPSGPESLSL